MRKLAWVQAMSKSGNDPIPSHLESPQCEQTKTKDYQGDGSLLQPDQKSY